MPESVTDRPTSAWEPLLLFTKRPSYFFDQTAVREPASANTPARGNGIGKKNAATEFGLGIRANRDFAGSINEVLTSRNAWNYWLLSSEPSREEHYAAYPTELVRRCILAGTSERGACPTCGAPWRRVVEKVPTGETQKMADGWDTGPGAHGSIHRNGREKGETGVPVTANATVGWEPSCRCHAADPVPCEVLDPFGGSGTTGVVADRLGRNATLIDLKPDYNAMAERRIRRDGPLFADVTTSEGPKPEQTALPLDLAHPNP